MVKQDIVNFYLSISRAPMHYPGGMEAIALVASVKYQTWDISNGDGGRGVISGYLPDFDSISGTEKIMSL